ncbi:hypothetical protein P4O66_017039 [Electrophorus voltai]|uniref:Ig-like domain-containing protein n=1 Tax=Electrophorus voltai TaxID=2609070 RepID=A0AAD9DNT3_9TELE|nr:hypothetical protein P4O66_017039 [Electrophorus voltai]
MIITIYTVLISLSVVAVLGVTVEQNVLSLTKAKGKSAFISCKVTGLSSNNYLHWYQKKDNEPFKRILYVNHGGGTFTADANHPERRDFSVARGSYDLKVGPLKMSHSAIYYCAYWDTSSHSDSNYSHPFVSKCDSSYYDYKLFASGTRLIVTDVKPKEPVVSVYSISTLQENGKRSLLCQASDMSPELVRFTWESTGGKVPETDDELLEQQDNGRVTSMLIINQQKATSNKYTCKVTHETREKPYEISDIETKKPVLSIYSISTLQANGKRSLLCQASDMSPELVRFTWESTGGKVPETDDELLEQQDNGRVTSMLIINQQKATSNKYTCKVTHETREKPYEISVPEPEETVTGPPTTCAPRQKEEQNLIRGSSGLSQNLFLFRLTYVVLLVKNVLYFCSVSVLLYKRSVWNKEPLMSKTH